MNISKHFKLFTILLASQALVANHVEDELAENASNLVNEIIEFMVSSPSIESFQSLIHDIVSVVYLIGEHQNQTDLVKSRLQPLHDIRNIPVTKAEPIVDKTELHEQERKLMVAGFKEILSALFGMMINPSGMAIYTDRLVSGILKIVSSVFADGKVDKHDLDNMQQAVKDVLLNK